MFESPVEELLRNYIVNFLSGDGDRLPLVMKYPEEVWKSFCESNKECQDEYFAIANFIRNVAKDYDRKQRIKCQFCRIEEGFEVETPVRAELLCKPHRQDFELNFTDLTLTQPSLKYKITGEEGMNTR